ncbi:MAG: alpha/beta hydrolase [Bacteroidota bacterium]
MKSKLLLLHGALGSSRQFDALKEILSDRYDLYTMNFEGHGGRSSDQEFSIQLFTQNVITFLSEQGISKINIFGYSMGGYVALNLAHQHPELVEKIITLGTKFDWTEESAAKETRMLHPEKIEEKVPKFAEMLKKLHAPLDWKELMQKTAQMMLSMGAGEKIHTEQLQQIKQQVVIGLGSEDKMVSKEESEAAVDELPQASFRLLEGVQHPIDRVDPQTLANYISEEFTSNP